MLNFLSYPRALILSWLVPGITLVFSAGAVLFIAPFASRKTTDTYIRAWAWVLINLSGVRLKITGQENLRGVHAAILVSNHMALLDIPVLFSAIPLSFRMAAKSELFNLPLFGRAITRFGFFPVLRGSPESSARSFGVIKERFSRGESFWMAPEGTRFKGEGIGVFKAGAFYLALEAKQPIVPICLFGTHKVLPKNSLLINWGKLTGDVHVSILPPVYPDKFSSRHEMRDHVRQLLLTEFDQLRESNSSPHQTIGASTGASRC